jgi:hypothetical protein
VFDGAPALFGKGLSLVEPDVRIVRQGGRLDTSLFVEPTPEEAKPARRAGIRTERRKDGAGVSTVHVVSATLALDLVLDTEDGLKTVKELWLGNAGHVRCQSPYRYSISEAAYFGQHDRTGEPFLFDTGADSKYVLCPEDAAGPEPVEFVEALKAWLAANGGEVDGPEQIKAASERVRNAITAAVRHGWAQSAVDVLTEQIATLMAKPYGVAKSRLSSSFRKEAKEAAKARHVGGEAPTDSETVLAELNDRYAVVMIGGPLASSRWASMTRASGAGSSG